MKDSIKTHRAFTRIAISWLLLFTAPVFAAFTASVDRTKIAIHETLELTLRADVDSTASPDLSVLSTNFDVLGTRQSRQVQIINGRTQSWRDWIVTLSPKKAGSLAIPAIALGNEKSTAIAVDVIDSRNSGNSQITGGISPVFMRAQLDSEQVYTQQQILLTLKIFHSVSLFDDSRLSPLDVDDAIVNQLGDTKKYETVIDGTRYGVFELQFAISPQKAGTLVIPPLSFTGTIADRHDPFGGVFSMGGKPIVARSPEIVVNVKAPPANYAGHTWLPAKNLTLTEIWSQPVDSIKVGDAVTRTITLEAEGLNSAQLPPLHIPSPDGVNTYPDQSSTDDSATANGVVGKRVSAIAMVPTEAGKFRLPPVKITWFDTQQQKARVAEIPATTLDVKPSANQPVTQSSVQNESAPVSEDQVTKEAVSSLVQIKKESDLWKWLAAGMTGLWLITALALSIVWNRVRKKQRAPSTSSQAKQVTVDEPDEASAFRSLQNACMNGDKPEMILEHLKQWAQLFLKDSSLRTAQQCAKALKSEPLQILCAEIDASIYSGDNSKAAGDELLSVCSVVRKTYKKETKSGTLSELYPEV